MFVTRRVSVTITLILSLFLLSFMVTAQTQPPLNVVLTDQRIYLPNTSEYATGVMTVTMNSYRRPVSMVKFNCPTQVTPYIASDTGTSGWACPGEGGVWRLNAIPPMAGQVVGVGCGPEEVTVYQPQPVTIVRPVVYGRGSYRPDRTVIALESIRTGGRIAQAGIRRK